MKKVKATRGSSLSLRKERIRTLTIAELAQGRGGDYTPFGHQNPVTWSEGGSGSGGGGSE